MSRGSDEAWFQLATVDVHKDTELWVYWAGAWWVYYVLWPSDDSVMVFNSNHIAYVPITTVVNNLSGVTPVESCCVRRLSEGPGPAAPLPVPSPQPDAPVAQLSVPTDLPSAGPGATLLSGRQGGR